MKSIERLQKAFNLELPDRPPILGGWLAAPAHVQAITGCSEDDYWWDPFHWGLEAEKKLGSDGAVNIFTPVARGTFRCVDAHTLAERGQYTIESMLEEIDALPDPRAQWAAFDEELEYGKLVAELKTRQSQYDPLLYCPDDWDLIPIALWYGRYGYETALSGLALQPDRYRKIIRWSAERGRQRATLRARAIREGLHPRAILTGEDLCSQRGPMVSPAFLRQEYYHLLEYALEPLLQAGAKIVWHCDGDVRPLLADLLACGIHGLQGFQRECGMQLEWIVDLLTRPGDLLLVFGPMEVTTILPFGTPTEVKAEVQRAMQTCRGKASLVFFTSNTITPDIPLENLYAYWGAVLESRW